ncbi:hypothetical protein [Candidatus Rhodobacter oscarellae]|uniref:hypothetical protein n=1 Tax=Candidatus Rhodobacter oscarellae TaxID=1675527 RepID=UPI000A7C5726|nr:hypothetical protein [Candidatus Rhodobacter lobularis]
MIIDKNPLNQKLKSRALYAVPNLHRRLVDLGISPEPGKVKSIAEAECLQIPHRNTLGPMISGTKLVKQQACLDVLALLNQIRKRKKREHLVFVHEIVGFEWYVNGLGHYFAECNQDALAEKTNMKLEHLKAMSRTKNRVLRVPHAVAIKVASSMFDDHISPAFVRRYGDNPIAAVRNSCERSVITQTKGLVEALEYLE